MASVTTVSLLDDLDGTSAAETVVFGLDGASYEIDLTEKNARKLRDAMANYVAHARRVDGGRRAAGAGRTRARQAKATRPSRSAPDREQTAAIREWARANGHEVSERGRLSAAVLEAFEAAH
ncbi:histone-like nucleoid-structuring protein Lsr2 [Nakamurella endophytica]|uniref:Lsr2 family protein n=1 Tax=Nakamurella endophytica TaxID=1748367 RepID=A0A917WGY5_9ACTN|nr:Lsr2 family protein [Nakamurella endophytica]GGM04221.1 Lsr2 family protein [Nakamurella endophytica]